MADGRQRRLAVELMYKRGFPDGGFVSDVHRICGATDDDIGISVEEWVEGLDQRAISSLIDRLFTGECSASASAPAAAPGAVASAAGADAEAAGGKARLWPRPIKGFA